MIYWGLIIAATTELLDQVLSAGSFTLSPSRLFIIALLVMAMMGSMMSTDRTGLGTWAKRYLGAVLCLLVATLASVYSSADLAYSGKRVLNATSLYLLPIFVYFYLRVASKRYPKEELLNKVGRVIVKCGLFLSLFGFVQEVTGFAQHASEVRTVAGLPFRRINGLHPDGNFFAYFLTFPIWILAVGTPAMSGVSQRWLKYVAQAIMFGAMLLTGSRGGLLMLAALGFSAAVFHRFKSRPWLVMLLEAPLVILTPLVLALYAYYGFEHIFHNVNSLDTSTDSGFSRVMSWYSGLMLYMQHPLLGIGPGNFVTLDKGLFLPSNYVHPWTAAQISVLAAHSNVLETLVESGPFALAAYYLMQLTVYWALLRASTRYGDERFAVYRSLFFAAAIGNILITYFSIFLMMLIGILLFAIDRDLIETATQKRPPILFRHAFNRY